MTDDALPPSGVPVLGDRRLERLRGLARLLDSAFVVPGTRFRFGLDALIGLVPGLGDAVGAVLSGYIILEAVRFGVPRATLMRMLWNVGVETVIGVIPAAGDLFDAAYKANLRNIRLLDRHTLEPERARASSRRFVTLVVGGVVVGIVVIVALAVTLGIVLSQKIAQLF